MIITIEKKELGNAVTSVARFAQRQSGTLPVLSSIILIAGDDGIKLRATNLETGIDLKLEGTIKTPGVVALPAATFREITSSFSGSGLVTLEHSGEVVTLSSPGSRSTLKTLPYEDFPTLPFSTSPKPTFSLPGVVFRSLVGMVAGFASPSTVRPELASVLLAAEGGTIKAVATDSFRLCEKKITPSGTISPFSILIPAKNISEILPILPDDTLDAFADDHQCTFSWKNGMITTRLVTVSYPDYTQIIPKTSVADATLLRKDFEATLKRTAVFSDAFQKIKLTFEPKDKKIMVSAHNADVGDSSETLPAVITGDAIELSFNHRYLQAPLPLMSAESITLSASGIGRAMVLRGVGDSSFLYLVMPMNQ